jgi:hypothetical protein
MVLESIPAIVPKFCMFIWIAVPFNEAPENATIRVSLDGKEIISNEVNFRKAPDLGEEETSSPTKWLVANPIYEFSPFEIPQPGVLRVSAFFEEEELRAPALTISEASRAPSPEEKSTH